MKALFRNALILISLAPLQVGAGQAQTRGMLGQLFGSEMPQDYESGGGQAQADKRKAEATKQHAAPRQPRAKKEARAVRKRKLDNVPLPPRRPWGDQDAAADNLTASTIAPAPVAARETPEPEPDKPIVNKPAPQVNKPAPQASPSKQDLQAVVLIAQRGLKVDDLRGRRIATGLSGETPERLKEIVEQGAGLQVSPVTLSWSAGLAGLVRGDVDGVTLSVGPRLTAEETQGLAMGSFQVLEIPLDREKKAADGR